MKYIAPVLCLVFILACRQDGPGIRSRPVLLTGRTMGTSYNITYVDSVQRDLKPQVDDLLEEINLDVSTYIEESFISRFNRSQLVVRLDSATANPHFQTVFTRSREIYADTKGYFDPTVMPLVNYWGFGYTEKKAVTEVDSVKVDSLKNSVGLNKLSRSETEGQIIFYKEDVQIQLDFSAIAKGYGVDAVGEIMEKAGIQNYLVEIGREVRARGQNSRGTWWTIGINTPREDAGLNDLIAVVPLRDQSVATSGNYRNYYEVNGLKYGHQINPLTGYPEQNNLLSVSVFAEDCMTADGYATALMVMGLEKALQFVEARQELEAVFVYGAADGKMKVKVSSGLEDVIN